MEEKTRIDILIDNLWYCLPAATYAEIAKKMSQRMGERISIQSVQTTLHRLRTNATVYEWTVPHAKHGINSTQSNRFVRVLIDRDGMRLLEEGAVDDVQEGLESTVAEIGSKARNEADAIIAAALHLSSRAKSRMFKDFADDLAYLSRKAITLLETMRDNGTTG